MSDSILVWSSVPGPTARTHFKTMVSPIFFNSLKFKKSGDFVFWFFLVICLVYVSSVSEENSNSHFLWRTHKEEAVKMSVPSHSACYLHTLHPSSALFGIRIQVLA